MGLSWQQGPLGGATVGRFLTPEPLPQRLLFAEPLRRRMRVRYASEWIADSEEVVLLHEPGRYPVAYFPLADIRSSILIGESRKTQHRDLGDTTWFKVSLGDRSTDRAAWRHTALPEFARMMQDRVAFAWRAMDAFYEEDERIVGHAADQYHRIDIRQSSCHLVVRIGDRIIADTTRPLVLFESGFAPRWYVLREDIDQPALTPVDGQTFCPYKGMASYYDIDRRRKAAWSYPQAWPEVARVSNLVSFEPDEIDVYLDDRKLVAAPGQSVVPHGIDRGLDPDEMLERSGAPDAPARVAAPS
jgi:uncharacterized protein (DUF427 family)